MFIRALDDNGDITTKLNKNQFAIEQLLRTRLKMIKGDWFLNQNTGLDLTLLREQEINNLVQSIKQIILTTEGVMLINHFTHNVNIAKELNINCNLTTRYTKDYKLNLTI